MRNEDKLALLRKRFVELTDIACVGIVLNGIALPKQSDCYAFEVYAPRRGKAHLVTANLGMFEKEIEANDELKLADLFFVRWKAMMDDLWDYATRDEREGVMNLLEGLDDFYKKVLQAPRRKSGRAKRGGCDSWRNFNMKSLAVHPKQVKQARDRAKRHGIAVEYKDDGTVVVQSPAARKALMKMEGYHDESGYGGIYG